MWIAMRVIGIISQHISSTCTRCANMTGDFESSMLIQYTIWTQLRIQWLQYDASLCMHTCG
jgi:hypothetical protein